MSEPLFPKFYTTQEGGKWHPWLWGQILETGDLEQRGHTVWIFARHAAVLVHALAFADPSNNLFPRWDSWNGWARRFEVWDLERRLLERCARTEANFKIKLERIVRQHRKQLQIEIARSI